MGLMSNLLFVTFKIDKLRYLNVSLWAIVCQLKTPIIKYDCFCKALKKLIKMSELKHFVLQPKAKGPGNYLSCCCSWIFCLIYALVTSTTVLPLNFHFDYVFIFIYFIIIYHTIYLSVYLSIYHSINLTTNLFINNSICQSITR